MPTPPLPILLGGVEVRVSGVPAPIYAVTKSQVNFVVPPEVAAGRYIGEVPVEFRIKGQPAGSTRMLLRDLSRAILVNDAADAFRPSVAFNQDGSLNAQSNPALLS